MITAGIDAGSRALKALLLDSASGRVLARGQRDQGIRQDALAAEVLAGLLAQAGMGRDDLGKVVATGYARNVIRQADAAITEITCHARGVAHASPGARTVVEIGGQDSKVIHLDGGGRVRDFAMNDRCAAGTGRFLEMLAVRLEVELEKLGALAAQAQSPAAISSMCVVFAETEIIGLLAGGAEPADIVAGVQRAVAHRVASLAGRELPEPVVFTGGVALVGGMSDALAEALSCPVNVAPDAQYTGALGAAILAAERA